MPLIRLNAIFSSLKKSMSSINVSSRSFTKPPTRTASPNLHPPARKAGEAAISLNECNPAVLNAQYAVRGEIPIRAEELREKLEKGENVGFEKVINCNIGNPQQLGQKPLTFVRQVASLVEYPPLLTHPLTPQIFPADAISRASQLLKEIGSIGAYSHSKGVPAIRKRVAEFIKRRDGHPSNPDNIYLTAGASSGVSTILSLILSPPFSGLLIPIPQYPLYTATLSLLSSRPVPYYLSESHSWGLDINSLRDSVKHARDSGTQVRGMVVINPGNPTGQCLSEENMKEVVKFCFEERLVLLADEVYQTNIYNPKEKPFVSFKKVLRDLGEPYASTMELVSFHSISKGQIGECGRRGGYFELVNIPTEIEEQIYKLVSISLCPPIQGQIAVDTMLNPPTDGESAKLWKEETEGIANAMEGRSKELLMAFRQLEGVECNEAEGAMYLFPRLTFSQRFLDHAASLDKSPDTVYCLKLLEKTGICVVPGSGFGQEDETWHFRTTFLAPGTEEYARRLKEFHEEFMNEWR